MALNKGYIAIVGWMVPEIEKYFVTAVANTRRYECTTRDGKTHTHFTFIILLYDMTSLDKKLLNWTCTSVRGDHGCTTAAAIGWRESADRMGSASKGRWSMFVWVAERGCDVQQRVMLYILTWRAFINPLYSRNPRPSHPCARAAVFTCVYIMGALTCRPGLLALQVHVGLYLGIVVRNSLADGHKPLDGQVHPLADSGYRPCCPLRAERSFPVRHQRRYL